MCVPPAINEMYCCNIHPFSWNYALDNYNHRTAAYNSWISKFKNECYSSFPTQEDMEADGIDFNKPIRIYIRLVNLPKFDTANLDKSFIDRLFNEYDGVWLVDDNIVRARDVSTIEFCDNYNDGKIYWYIENMGKLNLD